ncbi:MAG: sensor histidine kinase [Bacteroidota bacterium]
MNTEISVIEINNEMDLVLAHRRAIQICKFAGIGISEQTRFATAVSEICRNSLVYCNKGKITFNILKIGEQYKFEAIIEDKGSGIKDLEEVLSRNPQHFKGRGLGIVFARKLADGFKINTSSKGTRVVLEKYIALHSIPINSLIIKGWILHIKNEPVVSAYEELKNRNEHLLELTEELKYEKIKVEEQMNEIKLLNTKLENNNAYMQQFTYTVSHDLKTPLTSLKLALTFLKEDIGSRDDKLGFVNVIANAATKLESTIVGLVEILDLQNHGVQVARSINFEKVLNDIKEQLIVENEDNHIKVKNNFESVKDIFYVPAYITSIFNNLISNSIKYSSPKRPLQIDVHTAKKDGYIMLSFADNGEGIDLDKYGSQLFAPFTRLTNRSEGKGIGLYIIKDMIEKNGGKVLVESVPDKGTTFSFYLKEYDKV